MYLLARQASDGVLRRDTHVTLLERGLNTAPRDQKLIQHEVLSVVLILTVTFIHLGSLICITQRSFSL